MADRRNRHLVVAAALAALVAGCAQEPPVQVVSDSLCRAAKKRTWSINDTPESIEEAVRYNRGIDRACGVPGEGGPTRVAAAP